VDVDGDVTASVVVRAAYSAQYDQAGLALRVDEPPGSRRVEYVDGLRRVSCVVTRTSPTVGVHTGRRGHLDGIGLRLRRSGDAVHVHWRPAPRRDLDRDLGAGTRRPRRAPGGAGAGGYEADGWRLLRLLTCRQGRRAGGPVLRRPDGPGFAVRFEQVRVGRPA